MAATESIRVWKSFTYRGQTKLWSNRYHYNGSGPTTQAYFNSMADTIVNAEKAIYHSEVTITLVEQLPAGSDVPTYSKTYTTAGTLSTTGASGYSPGDTAMVARYATTARTSKNHPIYLFNYYHGCWQDTTGYPDALFAGQKTALETYATSWITGYSWGGGIGTIVRAGPNGATAVSRIVLPEITHRDFPR